MAAVPVGVDIQEHTVLEGESVDEASCRFRRMAHRFFHPTEAEFVDEEGYYGFFSIWSARESYVKYTGKGIDAEFSEFCVIPQSRKVWPFLRDISLEREWTALGVVFWEKVYRDEYTLCVCTEEFSEIIFVE